MCKISVINNGKTVEVDINDFDSKIHSLLGTSVMVKMTPVEIHKLNPNLYWYKNSLVQQLPGDVLNAVDPGGEVPVYRVDFPMNGVGSQWLPKKACSQVATRP